MSNRLVYIIGKDTAVQNDLADQIGHYGYGVTIFEDISVAARKMVHYDPAVMILNLSRSNLNHTIELINKQQIPLKPLIILLEKDSLELRLQAIRIGNHACFLKPVSLEILIGKLDEITNPVETDPFHVLIVEHDPAFAGELAAILNDAEMIAKVALNPAMIMESLVEYNSDLILMNTGFPNVLGYELAAVIRQQKAFQDIPIIFYGQNSNDLLEQKIKSGPSDDILSLPFDIELLISSICSKAKRYRFIKALIVKDGLTALMNHTRMREMMIRETYRAERQKKSISFALLDIDKFKIINDTYGHPAGDSVIKSLAHLIKQRFWSSDIVGRFGGEEFAIIIKSLDIPSAARVINEMRVDFSQIKHQSDLGNFYATFSTGIADFSRYRGVRLLDNAAERAVKEAKRRGGNRVACIGSKRL